MEAQYLTPARVQVSEIPDMVSSNETSSHLEQRHHDQETVGH